MDYRPLAGISAVAVLVLFGGFTARADHGSRVCLEFTDLRMTLEENATDGDTEVVLFAFLSHAIASETQILSAGEDETLPRDHVVVSWAAIPEAEVYLVEVKNEETENALLVEVPVPMISFEVPLIT